MLRALLPDFFARYGYAARRVLFLTAAPYASICRRQVRGAVWRGARSERVRFYAMIFSPWMPRDALSQRVLSRHARAMPLSACDFMLCRALSRVAR